MAGWRCRTRRSNVISEALRHSCFRLFSCSGMGRTPRQPWTAAVAQVAGVADFGGIGQAARSRSQAADTVAVANVLEQLIAHGVRGPWPLGAMAAAASGSSDARHGFIGGQHRCRRGPARHDRGGATRRPRRPPHRGGAALPHERSHHESGRAPRPLACQRAPPSCHRGRGPFWLHRGHVHGEGEIAAAPFLRSPERRAADADIRHRKLPWLPRSCLGARDDGRPPQASRAIRSRGR
mmetsp:Transcript_96358/g.272528  ORF Transcript_96358/g.272528 Transcript_96358/m.272528 type:complete len:237 (-) Transcript_96358:996-1706(-)